MGSKVRPFTCVIGTALVLAPMFVTPLTGGQEQISLGDLARQERDKQGKDFKKPARVFTNDDFPLHPPNTSPTPAGTLGSAAEAEKSTGRKGSDAAASPSGPHDEEYFRSRMKEFRKKLEDDKEFLSRIQREVTAHNTDLPCSTCANARWGPGRTDSLQIWASEDQRLRSLIQSQETKIARDEQAASDLVEQCRRERCLPDWVR